MSTAALNMTLTKSYKDIKSTLNLLNEASVWRDKFTTFHEARVGKISEILAQQIGFSAVTSEILGRASCFHDIGKFGVPEEILHKRDVLTPDEFEIVQKHSQIGADIFKKVKGPFCELASSIALIHHEKMDGSGYPHGLEGHQISLEGRIIALADVYDALRSSRHYKLAHSHSEATDIIFHGDDRTRPEHFDEKVLKAFDACSDRLQEIYVGADMGRI